MTRVSKKVADQQKAERENIMLAAFCLQSRAEGVDASVDFTVNKFSPFDAYITINGKRSIAEVKVRKYTTKQIDRWGGIVLEAKKLAGINDAQADMQTDMDIYYFNFLKDSLRIYKLNAWNTYEWNYMELQANDYHKKSDVIQKLVTKIDHVDCVIDMEIEEQYIKIAEEMVSTNNIDNLKSKKQIKTTI